MGETKGLGGGLMVAGLPVGTFFSLLFVIVSGTFWLGALGRQVSEIEQRMDVVESRQRDVIAKLTETAMVVRFNYDILLDLRRQHAPSLPASTRGLLQSEPAPPTYDAPGVPPITSVPMPH